MIHAADAGDRIPHASGDAAAEQRRQHRARIVGDVLLALDDVDALMVEAAPGSHCADRTLDNAFPHAARPGCRLQSPSTSSCRNWSHDTARTPANDRM